MNLLWQPMLNNEVCSVDDSLEVGIELSSKHTVDYTLRVVLIDDIDIGYVQLVVLFRIMHRFIGYSLNEIRSVSANQWEPAYLHFKMPSNVNSVLVEAQSDDPKCAILSIRPSRVIEISNYLE